MAKPFLTAEWINLLMANYHIDPAVLKPYVPAFTELDTWNGNHYVSLVGFLFKNTEVFGCRFPYHTTFEEVNLRFYVRYKEGNEWKRGVVFIKEIVPKAMISFIANTLYHEHYETRSMSHLFEIRNESFLVQYSWKTGNSLNYLKATSSLTKAAIRTGSEEEFITEHYWGYTRIHDKKTTAYEVQHPRWRVHNVREFDMQCDVVSVYGNQFRESLSSPPTSVFLADGSLISVMNKQTIT